MARARVPRGVDTAGEYRAYSWLRQSSAACRRAPGIRRGAARKQAPSARRDLLLPVVRQSHEGRPLGALVRRSRRHAGALDPRTSRAAASTRRRTPRSSARRCVRSRAAGVGTIVVSWWGFDSPENDRLLLVEQAAARDGLEVAIHVEPYRGRTPAKAAEDIARLNREGGFTDFYVYDADRDPATEWADRARAARRRPRLRAHALRRTCEGLGVRRALHVRRGHVERRAVPPAVHAGARGRPALRPFRRAGVRRAARDALRGRASSERRAHVRPDVEDGAEGRTPTSSRSRATTSGRKARRSSPRGSPSGGRATRERGGRTAWRRSARTSRRRSRWAERLRGRDRASVERGREPAAVRDRHGIVMAEVVEDCECDLAEPLAPLGRGVRRSRRARGRALSPGRPPRARRGPPGSSPLSRNESTTPATAVARVAHRGTTRRRPASERPRTRRRRGRPGTPSRPGSLAR